MHKFNNASRTHTHGAAVIIKIAAVVGHSLGMQLEYRAQSRGKRYS